MHFYGNSAAVVDDGYFFVFVDYYVNVFSKSCECLVDGIVDDFFNEFMEAVDIG